jgi:multiple sugar transport system substrate-binding protein
MRCCKNKKDFAMRGRLLLVLMLLALSGVSAAQGETLIFWSTEEQPERAAATAAIIERFTAATGVQVALVLTNEDILDSMLTANLAAGTLPDVIFHPVDYAAAWYAGGILDPAAATAVINDLGAAQFSGLNLVTLADGSYSSVPSDGWGQLLIYRQDLFDAAGLETPDTFARILTAAQALHDPASGFYGIAAATDPAAVFTQQTFEHFALANGVDLTDDAGNVTLNTPQMVEAIRFYADLVTDYGAPRTVDLVRSRSLYFDGQAAMLIWSPFVLDEMAGLRDAALPACPQCAADAAFIARNSGFVPAFIGPGGDVPAQYGQFSMLGITTRARPAAQDFVKFWLNDAYLDWLAVAPEGKFPMRSGTPDNPAAFIEGWAALPAGVDRKAPLGDFYSPEVIQIISAGAARFDRWGFARGQGLLLSAVYQDLTVPRYLVEVIRGTLTPEEAAAAMQAAVEEIQTGLE